MTNIFVVTDIVYGNEWEFVNVKDLAGRCSFYN